MSKDDVTDSTDWLSTPLPTLSALESALRCQVCKDFYQTPMITSCSHTFCSLCIRRALSGDNKCPLCRASEQEIRLRSNWSMEEAVESFKKSRQSVLDLARSAGAEAGNRSPKRKAQDVEDLGDQVPPEAKRLRSSARLTRSRSQATPSYVPEVEETEVVIQASDDEDDEFIPEPADGLVPCPMCQRRMKEWQVFTHLETCPGSESKTISKTPERGSVTQLGTLQRQQNSLERLPALSYSILKENALRKKLAELRISNQGPRALLEKRHKEWITLWNANCDAAYPKSRSELLRDLETWEKTQGGRAPVSSRAAQNAAMIKDKDFDGSAWAAKHDTSFRDLIANARKTSAAAKKPQSESREGQRKHGETTGHPDVPSDDAPDKLREVVTEQTHSAVVSDPNGIETPIPRNHNSSSPMPKLGSSAPLQCDVNSSVTIPADHMRQNLEEPLNADTIEPHICAS